MPDDRRATIDVEAWVCPAPLRDSPNVVMGHGGGGAMSNELIEHLFLPAFGSAADAGMGDSAVLTLGGARLAFSTDSYVVKPMVFPGGTIGDLAVNGTVNDLAMSGARAAVLSTAFILEEGTPLDELARVAHAVGTAALAAGVKLVTGDTKVVDSGHGDGVYINTAGIGLLDEGIDIRPQRAGPGDVVIISGDIGVHGVAVMSCRDGLEFATTVTSDTAPLNGLVAAMIGTGADIHAMRDPTRGGLAATLNEIAKAAHIGVALDERALPIPPDVRDACGLLGLDPLQVANEGKLVAFVAEHDAERVLAAMHAHPLGARAAVIGRGVDEHPGMVAAKTALGGTRVVDMPIGEQLPPDLLMTGRELFASYAFPPNELGYCGPADTSAAELASHADEFDGAWAYLQAIADAAGVSDPLDDDVVRNYWVGGSLLDKVDDRELLARLRNAFAGQVTGLLDDVSVPAPVLAHHSFHVVVVYPWIGFLDRDPVTPLKIMQDCRIRWGVVDSVDDRHATIVSRPLTFDGAELGLGDPVAERVRWNQDGSALAPAPVPGETVTAHWDWICDRLSDDEAAALCSATGKTLDLVNGIRRR